MKVIGIALTAILKARLVNVAVRVTQHPPPAE